MKIYTSYYGNMRNLKSAGLTCIGISLYGPKALNIASISQVAPRADFMHDPESIYKPKYQKILDRLNAKEIYRLIQIHSNGRDVALLCYEKPFEFCHRHLLAKWLNEKLNLNIVEFGSSIIKKQVYQKKELELNL